MALVWSRPTVRLLPPPVPALLLLLAGGVLTATAWPALSQIAGAWLQDEYSHAWLIGPLAALLYLSRLPGASRGRAKWAGPATAVLSLALMLGGWAARNTTLSVYGLIAGFLALTSAALGLASLRRLAAPIAFLLFMIPLPLAVYISLSQAMQLTSSRLGVGLIRALGVAVVREGNVIDLANGRLEVAEACSGLRYLFPLLSIAFLLATLLEDRWWKKLALFLSAFPIALIMNGLRLALIGVLVDRFGPAMASGPQHEIEGFVVFALCIGVLIVAMAVLRRVGPHGTVPGLDALLPNRRTLKALGSWPAPTPFLIAVGLLVSGALAVLALPARREIIPDRQPLALFPMHLGAWRGAPQALDRDSLQALGLTDYVMADYTLPPADGPVSFYVAYYATQRLGLQVHSPRLCIPGGGWDILGQSEIRLLAADGSAIPANRVVIEKGATRQIVYYWFAERGRWLTSEAQIKVYAVLDAVKRDRSDGALVRLVARVREGREAEADQNLRALAQQASAVLPTYVPD